MRHAQTAPRFAIHAAIAALCAAALVQAACGSSGNTFTAPSALSKCAVTTEASASTFPAAGGTTSIAVNTERECQWTATPDGLWLKVTSGASGQGPGTVQLAAAANADPVTRTAAVVVNNQRVQIAQDAADCRIDLGARSASFPSAGGTGSVDVLASSPLCPWSASSDSDWIAITSGASGKGSASVAFRVSATAGGPRTGTIRIGGVAFTVDQSEGCAYTISPATYAAGSSGGSTSVTVTAGPGCPWTAASNASWISLTAPSGGGSGNGSVGVTVAPTTGPTRTGTATIAGQTFTVTQSPGCTFAVAPLTLSIGSAGGSASVNVTAGAGCAWTAESQTSWLSITSGASGSGNGTVSVNAAPTSGPSRSGTFSVAGVTVTVNQGQGCTFALSPASASAPATGGAGRFDVGTAAGCSWSASSNASWLSVTAGSTGTGNGSVQYAVAANAGPPRTGTITAGDQTFTVTQDAGCSFAISPSTQNMSNAGGTASVGVTAPAGCGWTAASNASWISISSDSSGSGNGTVQLAVAANTDADRTGTATIAGQTFTIVQGSGCTYSLSPSSQQVPAGGAPGSFAVSAGAMCAWTATSSAAWIGLSMPAAGTGPGTVQFLVAPNNGGARTGTIAVAGQTFTVNQDAGCSAAVAPDTIAAPAVGGSQNVQVTIPSDCAWTSASNAAWISISSGSSGTGNGTVQLAIGVNTGPARTGTATVAARTVTVNQASGCTFSIAPSSQNLPAQGGTGTVTVTTADGCAWSAVSNDAWIAVTAGAGGTGNGTVQFTVAVNDKNRPRSGTITIAGQTFTVNQAEPTR